MARKIKAPAKSQPKIKHKIKPAHAIARIGKLAHDRSLATREVRDDSPSGMAAAIRMLAERVHRIEARNAERSTEHDAAGAAMSKAIRMRDSATADIVEHVDALSLAVDALSSRALRMESALADHVDVAEAMATRVRALGVQLTLVVESLPEALLVLERARASEQTAPPADQEPGTEHDNGCSHAQD